ncbi:hypothetical protein [Labrys monachus]|uniref:Uncharacterized protein n=1 Tax=Labrys monachus TaxID=217067 RepID=A0ABU0FC58_9HYPH|nr:hypothetical protein [Labrys monachus]MDQ0392185.1 hypothetical protein [Labrys monachus]
MFRNVALLAGAVALSLLPSLAIAKCPEGRQYMRNTGDRRLELKFGNKTFKGKSLDGGWGATLYVSGKEHSWFDYGFSSTDLKYAWLDMTGWVLGRDPKFADDLADSVFEDGDLAVIDADTDAKWKSNDLAKALRQKYPRVSPVWLPSCHK